jgi:hypothetical protein
MLLKANQKRFTHRGRWGEHANRTREFIERQTHRALGEHL